MQKTIELENGNRARPATIFRHTKRDDWGLAVVLWEHEHKRGYRFEDGTVRVFADGYYHLLRPVARLDAPATALEALASHGPVKASGARKSGPALPTLDDQLAYFLEQYPDGFSGEAWRGHHRGDGARRRLKRHRGPAVAEAAEKLSSDALKTLVEEGRWQDVRDRTVEVVGATDLVPKKHLDSLRRIEPTETLGRALHDLLHGHATSEGERFDALRGELGRRGAKATSWPLMTAVRALTHPDEHVCVRPSVFKPQTRVMGNTHRLSAEASPRAYTRYLEVARTVRDGLTERGHRPTDLLDVYDFVWETMRPAAREAVLCAASRTEEPTAEAA